MSFSKTLQLPQLSPSKSAPNLGDIGIKLRKINKNERYGAMYFKDQTRVNMDDWQSAKMARENNTSKISQIETEEPKFGAGSVFGKEAKEDARKRKFGIIAKKYDSASQPWMMRVKSKILGQTKKKFKGVKKGGIGENAGYYVMIQRSNGTAEAISLNDWYEFQQIQTYKSLTAEEAEEEYNRRERRMNFFDLMVQKRLRNNDEEEEIQDSAVKSEKKKNKQGRDFKISEMDEWVDSGDESDDSNSDDEKNDKGSDGKKKNNDVNKKKKKRDVAMEAFEESDDGDEEGRELDYISDSSASENELELQKEIKAVDEIESTSSDEELENNDNSDKSDNDDDEKEEGGNKNGYSDDKSKEKKKDQNDLKTESAASSMKRSRDDSLSEYVDSKKFKPDITNSFPSSSVSPSKGSGLTLEAVKRYLMRKPMATTDLLQKFKSKKTGLSSKEMAVQLTKIMQTLKPSTQKVRDKVYFFLGDFHRQNLTFVQK